MAKTEAFQKRVARYEEARQTNLHNLVWLAHLSGLGSELRPTATLCNKGKSVIWHRGWISPRIVLPPKPDDERDVVVVQTEVVSTVQAHEVKASVRHHVSDSEELSREPESDHNCQTYPVFFSAVFNQGLLISPDRSIGDAIYEQAKPLAASNSLGAYFRRINHLAKVSHSVHMVKGEIVGLEQAFRKLPENAALVKSMATTSWATLEPIHPLGIKGESTFPH